MCVCVCVFVCAYVCVRARVCVCVWVYNHQRAGAQVPTAEVKRRSRQISELVETFTEATARLVGSRQRVWIVDDAADGIHRVGHTKTYTQVGSLPLSLSLSLCVCVCVCVWVCHSSL